MLCDIFERENGFSQFCESEQTSCEREYKINNSEYRNKKSCDLDSMLSWGYAKSIFSKEICII